MNRILAISAVTLFAFGAEASATYDGIVFPAGDISFADAVHSFAAGVPPATDPDFIDPAEATGAPDYVSPNGAFSLGSGGQVILQFTDNSLTGSGDDAFDLHIFEIGPDVEDTFVAISTNGVDFLDVGKVLGSTSSIDIDPYLSAAGLDAYTQFSFVRLIDDPNEGEITGLTVGADIDAVGAISSAPPVSSVPLPVPGLLLASAVVVAGLRFRRKQG